MEKRNKINFSGYVLTLFYLIGLLPSVWFHHHDTEIISFAQATDCEKVIYYGKNDASSCHHNKHISKLLNPCGLCDHIGITPQIASRTKTDLGQTLFFTKQFIPYDARFKSVEKTFVFNKDPPLLKAFSN